MEFYEELSNSTGNSCLFDSCDDCDAKCDDCDSCDSRCDYEDSCGTDDTSCDYFSGGCSCDYDRSDDDSCYRD